MAPPRGHRKRSHVLLAIGAVAVGGWLAVTTLTPNDRNQASAREAEVQGSPEILTDYALTSLSVTNKSFTKQTVGNNANEPSLIKVSHQVTTNQDFENRASKSTPLKATPEHATSKPNTNLEWTEYTIRRGDTLGRIFEKHDLNSSDAVLIANSPKSKILKKLTPGQKLEFGYDSGRLVSLNYELNTLEVLAINIDSNKQLEINTVEAQLDTRIRFASGNIESSLFRDGANAGLSDKLITELVGIFGWDIDFALDLRKGDSFAVAYEEISKEGKVIDSGNILAASFVNQGRNLEAIRHSNDQGGAEYYDAEGNNLRGTFLRTPLTVSRVTSGFSKRRLHPILKKWRAHKGVDYGAPRGTKVLATADGRVSFVGRRSGYGKVIVLRHGGKYSTLYAHLSSYKSGIRPGVNIKQKQVIGFVGRTGMATAPHLHYEFRVHGVHRNPLTFETPKAGAINKKYKAAFLAQAQTWIDKLAQHSTTILAQNEGNTGG